MHDELAVVDGFNVHPGMVEIPATKNRPRMFTRGTESLMHENAIGIYYKDAEANKWIFMWADVTKLPILRGIPAALEARRDTRIKNASIKFYEAFGVVEGFTVKPGFVSFTVSNGPFAGRFFSSGWESNGSLGCYKKTESGDFEFNWLGKDEDHIFGYVLDSIKARQAEADEAAAKEYADEKGVVIEHLRIGRDEYTIRGYRPGDGFTWSAAANFNHGCDDGATFCLREDGRWDVTDVTNCTSCWPVGHDRDHSCGYYVGEIVDNPPTEILG
jgi:hypothetical protein